MFEGNKIKSALRANRVPIGMQCFSGSDALVEIMGYAGFDYVMLDMEHSPLDWGQLQGLVRTASAAGMSPLVRVPDNNSSDIRRALETGAHGVIVPQVQNADDVRAALAAALYPSEGHRGMCPATRASRYSIDDWNSFIAWTKSEITVIPIIENRAALESIEEICAIPGIDIINFGPGDLGQNLGVGAGGMSTAPVQEAFRRVMKAANEHNKAVMTVPFPDLSSKACGELLAAGVKVLMHTVDELLFMQECRRILADLAPLRSF